MSLTSGRNPKITVVVPTKYANDTIRATLQTITTQTYANLEIVVSDTSHSDRLAQYIASLGDGRIRYIRPDKNQTFSDDWNSALGAVSGDYVTFVGDDDGIVPGGIAFAVQVLLANDCDAFAWRKINYNWPNHLTVEQRNSIEGQSEPRMDRIDSRKALRLLSKFRLGYARLPCIYNSVVRTSIVTDIRKKSPNQKFFGGVIPDVYSSIAIAAAAKNFIYAHFPITVNGASNSSSGIMQGIPDLDQSLKKLIPDVLNSHTRYHKDVGPFNTSVASIVMGEYLLAKGNLPWLSLPSPNWSSYVKYLFYEAKHSPHPERILASADHTTRSRRMKFLRRPKVTGRASGNPASFSGRLVVPQALIGNVEQAADLCRSLIPTQTVLTRHSRRMYFHEFLQVNFRLAVRIYQSLLINIF